MAGNADTARHMASTFVDHVALLLAINLANDLDPALAGFMPDDVPMAGALLDDQVLIGQVIRAPHGDARLEKALDWLERVWFGPGDRGDIADLVRGELDRRRHEAVLFGLDEAMDAAAGLLRQLVQQCAGLCDVSGYAGILAALDQWRSDRTGRALGAVIRLCRALLRHGGGRPADEQVRKILTLAQDAALPAVDYLGSLLSHGEGDVAVLTRRIRARYPLMYADDVAALLRQAGPVRRAAVA